MDIDKCGRMRCVIVLGAYLARWLCCESEECDVSCSGVFPRRWTYLVDLDKVGPFYILTPQPYSRATGPGLSTLTSQVQLLSHATEVCREVSPDNSSICVIGGVDFYSVWTIFCGDTKDGFRAKGIA